MLPVSIRRASRKQQATLLSGDRARASRFLFGCWILLLVLIIVGELLPGDSKPIRMLDDFQISDKLMHLAAYGAAAIVPTIGLRVQLVALCLVMTQATGMLLELGQSFIRGRSCDPLDVLANTAGLLAGTAVALFLRPRFRRLILHLA